MKLNATLLKSTVVAALGGLLFGFDTAVISGTTSALTQTYSLTPFLLGVTVFSALFGTVLGAMLAGFPGERYGRRDSLRVMAILYLISGLGCAFAWNWHALVVFRFIGGLGVGGSSVLGPMYIAEIAPGKIARPPGGILSVQRRVRNSGGLLLELRHQPATLRSHGMALGTRRHCDSRGPVLRHAVHHSAQPALAGQEGTSGRSPSCPADDGRRKLRA